MRPMSEPKLTGVLQHASSFGMQETNIAVGRKFLALSVGSLALWSCVTVEAPTEPIVEWLKVFSITNCMKNKLAALVRRISRQKKRFSLGENV